MHDRWTVGAMIPDGAALGDSLTAAARRIEDSGFDLLACGEHVLFRLPVPNSFVALAHAGAVTSRVGLLSSVTLVPLYPPGLLAKLVTTLQVTTSGRLHLGVGVGGEYDEEFVACDVPVAERGRRTDEALELLGSLPESGEVDFAGRFGTVRGRLLPMPSRRPPIWVGGRKDAARRRTARYGDVWLPYLVSARHVAAGRDHLLTEAEQWGRADGSLGIVPMLFVSIDTDDGRARRVAAEAVGAMYAQDVSDMADSVLLAGSPDRCTARLAQYAEAGSTGVVVHFVGDERGWADQVELFAADVLPVIRTLRAGR